MRVLLTGKHGQVATCLMEQFAEQENVSVLALDKKQLDISNQGAVNTTVADFQPNIIINAAAYTAVDKAEADVELCYMINRDGPKYLALAAQSVNAAILHISTDYVFDGHKLGQYVESDDANP